MSIDKLLHNLQSSLQYSESAQRLSKTFKLMNAERIILKYIWLLWLWSDSWWFWSISRAVLASGPKNNFMLSLTVQITIRYILCIHDMLLMSTNIYRLTPQKFSIHEFLQVDICHLLIVLLALVDRSYCNTNTVWLSVNEIEWNTKFCACQTKKWPDKLQVEVQKSSSNTNKRTTKYLNWLSID